MSLKFPAHRGRYDIFLLLAASLTLAGCGGGGAALSTQTTVPSAPAASPVNIQGQWQVVAQSTANPSASVLIETNFTQTGGNVVAGKSSVVLIQGAPGAFSGLGGECDNGVLGSDSVQATISGQSLSFTLTEAGSLGNGTSTGTATISQDGTQITAGTYSTPAACGFQADTGTLVGTLVRPFSGTFAGMLANGATSDAVTVTVSQTGSSISVVGTDNGAAFTLTGTAVGATFDVTGMIAGQSVEDVGIYEPTKNDFLVYDTSFDFLGTLNAQSPAPAPSPISIAVLPTVANVQVGQSMSFAATVMNDSASRGVTWTLSGIGCAGAGCGTLSASSSASGASITYTAPASKPSSSVTLTATSVSDTTKTAAATISITTSPSIVVTVSPTAASVATGGASHTFSATLQNDSQNKGVNWTVSGAACNNASCGIVAPASSLSGAAVTYTSPATAVTPATVVLTATSIADASVSATSTITLTAPTAPTPSAPLDLGIAAVDVDFGIPVIATDAAGNVDVAWIGTQGPEFVRSTDSGSTFSAPVTIPSDMHNTVDDNGIQMALDGSGNINLLWHVELTETSTVPASFFSRSSDGGVTFSTPVNPSAATSAQLIVRPDGKITIAWFDQTSSNLLATTSSDGVNFSTPATVWTAVGSPMDLAVAAGPQGQIYIFWTQLVTMTDCSILFSSSGDGNTFTPAASISGSVGSCNQTASVTVDPNGNINVAWDTDGGSLSFSRSTDSGATFSPPAAVPNSSSPHGQKIVVGPDASIDLLWESGFGVLFSKSTDAGVTFSPPLTLAMDGDISPPSIAVDSCNNVTVLGQGANVTIIYQRSTDGGATFGNPATLSNFTFDYEEELALDKNGNLHIVWGVDGPEEIEYVLLPTTCHVD